MGETADVKRERRDVGVAKLAIELYNKHSKASLAMMAAMVLKHGSGLRIGHILQDFLDKQPRTNLDVIKHLAQKDDL